MNIATAEFTAQPAGVSVISDTDGMQRFCEPACAAAIWDRVVPPDVTAWLAALDAAVLPGGRMLLKANDVTQAVQHLCDAAGMPDTEHRDWLVDDIATLAHAFADVMQVNFVRLRLQAITTNACRKFHLDAITGRLVCTYRGLGTQYGTSVQGDDPEHVFTVPTGAPILLRGSVWPPEPASGLLHRSPPIEGTGETRLVLVLDPISDLNEAE